MYQIANSIWKRVLTIKISTIWAIIARVVGKSDLHRDTREVAGGGNEKSQEHWERRNPRNQTWMLQAFQSVKLSLRTNLMLAHEFLCCMLELELPAHWAVSTRVTFKLRSWASLKIRQDHWFSSEWSPITTGPYWACFFKTSIAFPSLPAFPKPTCPSKWKTG